VPILRALLEGQGARVRLRGKPSRIEPIRRIRAPPDGRRWAFYAQSRITTAALRYACYASIGLGSDQPQAGRGRCGLVLAQGLHEPAAL
jgi:hypothetical protein